MRIYRNIHIRTTNFAFVIKNLLDEMSKKNRMKEWY